MSKIKAKILDQSDKQIWDKFVEYSPWADIFQTWEWGELQKNSNIKPLRIGVVKDGYLTLAMQILIKKIPLLGSYGSVVHGPVFTSGEYLREGLPVLVNFLSHLNKTYDLAFLEIEPIFGYFGEVLKKSESDAAENSLTIYDSETIQQFGSLAKLDQSEILEIFKENNFDIALPATFKQEKKWYLELSKNKLETPKINWELKSLDLTDPFVSEVSKFIQTKFKQQKNYSEGLLDPKLFGKFIQKFKHKENLKLHLAHQGNDLLALNLSTLSKYSSSSLFALAVEDKNKEVLSDLNLLVIDKIRQSGGQIFDLGIYETNYQTLQKTPKFLEKTVRINTAGNLVLPISPVKQSLWDTYHWLKKDGKKDFQKVSKKVIKETKINSKKAWKISQKHAGIIWQKTKREIEKLKTKLDAKLNSADDSSAKSNKSDKSK